MALKTGSGSISRALKHGTPIWPTPNIKRSAQNLSPEPKVVLKASSCLISRFSGSSLTHHQCVFTSLNNIAPLISRGTFQLQNPTTGRAGSPLTPHGDLRLKRVIRINRSLKIPVPAQRGHRVKDLLRLVLQPIRQGQTKQPVGHPPFISAGLCRCHHSSEWIERSRVPPFVCPFQMMGDRKHQCKPHRRCQKAGLTP